MPADVGAKGVGSCAMSVDVGGVFGLVLVALVAPLVGRLSLILARLMGFLPPRLVATYSQVMPRLAQRAHVGFSFEHFNFDDAHGSQLSLSLGAAGAAVLGSLEGPGGGDRLTGILDICSLCEKKASD